MAPQVPFMSRYLISEEEALVFSVMKLVTSSVSVPVIWILNQEVLYRKVSAPWGQVRVGLNSP